MREKDGKMRKEWLTAGGYWLVTAKEKASAHSMVGCLDSCVPHVWSRALTCIYDMANEREILGSRPL